MLPTHNSKTTGNSQNAAIITVAPLPNLDSDGCNNTEEERITNIEISPSVDETPIVVKH